MDEEQKNDDNEYEEEESLVVVELSGIMETDLVSQVQECKVLGIDTEKPLLQLDNYIFQGQYEDAMGTCMMFEEKLLPETDEFSTEAQKELEYQYLTNKKVLMQRVFIKKPMEEETDPTTGDDKVSENMEAETSAAQRDPQLSTSSATDAQHPGTSSADTTSQPGTSLDKDAQQPGSSTADSIPQPCSSLDNGISQTDSSSDHSASLPVTSPNNITSLTISNNTATQHETIQAPSSPQPSTSSDGIT